MVVGLLPSRLPRQVQPALINVINGVLCFIVIWNIFIESVIMNKRRCEKGFTLIEIMIAMAILSIAMAGIYKAFRSQQNTYMSQELVADMQQNARASTYVMQNEIRMAGYKGFNTTTLSSGTADAGIITAGPESITFSMNLNSDTDNDTSDPGEQISYSISGRDLIRNDGATTSILAFDIEAIGFAYAFEDTNDDDNSLELINNKLIWAVDADSDGILDTNIDTDGNGVINTADSSAGTSLSTLIDDDGDALGSISIDRIRAVRVWILSKTRSSVSHINTSAYKVGRQIITPSDRNKYILLSTTIKCRNLGLL